MTTLRNDWAPSIPQHHPLNAARAKAAAKELHNATGRTYAVVRFPHTHKVMGTTKARSRFLRQIVYTQEQG